MKQLPTLDPRVLSSVTGGQASNWWETGKQWASQAWNNWSGGGSGSNNWSAPQNPQPQLSPIKPGMNGLAIRERLGQVP